jgi:hypothetical protein
MDFSPSSQQRFAIFADQPHAFADVRVFHPHGPDECRMPVVSLQIDLGFSVSENMHMGWFMVVDENDDPEPCGTKNGHHPQ